MDRQKPRVGRSIDGFSSMPPKPQHGGFNRTIPKPMLQPYRPVSPSLQPRTNIDQVTRPVIRPQEVIRPGINRLAQPRHITSVDELDTYTPISTNMPGPHNTSSPAVNNPVSMVGSSLPINEFARHKRQRSKSKWRTPKFVAKRVAIALAVFIIGFGAWFGSSIIGNINKVFHGNVFSDAHALISGDNLKESGGRINILLAGDSEGDPNHQGASLADSIMVLSFDPSSKSGFILSIPRDLWVEVPTMGHQKINAANDVSNFNEAGYPQGGMGSLEKVVETQLGIPIDYYTLIDYAAFKDAVNTVGGISIDINSPDPRGIYDAYTHLKLSNGWVNLDGQQALDLARARGDNVAGDVSYGLPNSDFSRTEHQRQMLVALFKKASSIGVVSNPIKISDLFNVLGNNIKTDLSLGDVISLLKVSNGLNLSKMTSATYSFGGNNSLLKNYLSSSGQEALIPSLGENNFSQLKQYYKQLSSNNPLAKESPTVTLLNGSNVSGLASMEKKVLEKQGFNVVSISDATTEYPTSLIVDNSNGQKPNSLAVLKKDISGQVVNSVAGSTEAEEAINYNSDFVIVMGQDWDNTKTNGNPVQN